MNSTHFLIVFVLASSITILLTVRPSKSARYIGLVFIVLGLNAMSIAVTSMQTPTENSVVRILTARTLTDRTEIATHVAALGIGVLVGLAFGISKKNRKATVLVSCLYAGSLCMLVALTAKESLSPYLSDPDATGQNGLVSKTSAAGWQVRKVSGLPISPSAITWVDESTVLIAGYSGGYLQNGAVFEVKVDSTPPRIRNVAFGLTRPHGIAYRDGSIYVSRSGQFSRAVNGQMLQKNTGAITKISDLDGDGSYEFYHDVVTDLPGAQLPDGLHQNNGITFNKTGELFITVGTPTDHAPPLGELDGTILQCNEDGSDLVVFSEGFRNPYGIVFGPDGNLFCTDNDSNALENGDELNWVLEGGHYGHPYDVHPSDQIDQVHRPLLRLSSAQGLAFMQPNAGTAIDNHLLVSSFGDNSINAVGIDFSKSPPVAKPSFLANVPSVVAITCTPKGRIFACSYGDKSLYMVTGNPE